MIYTCCNEHRKAAILGNAGINGIDYLEVLDHDAPAGSPRQQTLLLHCVKPVTVTVSPANILITGGESITGITAVWVSLASAPPPAPLTTPGERAYFQGLPDATGTLVIRVSRAGDFSPYALRLVNDLTAASEDPFEVTEALPGFDPEAACIGFSFKVECGPDFDCAAAPCDCPPELPPPPPINYLAKDYGTLRSVMLDRLSQLLPLWSATSEADIGIMLTELLAFVGDRLSYQQDALATEAYLQTARSRISLRRHALLVDYHVHDGCNARAWVCVQASTPMTLLKGQTRFFTAAPGAPSDLKPGSGNEERALQAGAVIFEPLYDAPLYPEHNQLLFYTWGEGGCCLPAGATEATLLGTLPNLKPGDVLIFQEMLGPQTGQSADADLRHRCAVRLTRVATQDSQGQTLVDPLFEAGTGLPITSASQQPTPVTEIEWSADDALPFPVCLSSSFVDASGTSQTLSQVSVAFGNVVLADQGVTFPPVALPAVPAPTLLQPQLQGTGAAGDRCQPAPRTALPVRYLPILPDSPVTQAVPLPVAGPPVTPALVPLSLTGYVALEDAGGFTALMVRPANPAAWPQSFGLLATASGPGTFDLAVLYSPPGGPAGVSGPVTVERLTGLSVKKTDPTYAPAVINSLSRFIRVPPSYVPPSAAPSAFPGAPTMLPATGTVFLEDSASKPYLTVQPTNPLGWPSSFAVLVQNLLATPDAFNLLVLYAPSSGVGVPIPVLLEQFNAVSLATLGSLPSALISAEAFAGEPNLSLSAYDLMHTGAGQAVPAITLTGTLNGIASTWTPLPDLLGCSPLDKCFVVEVESGGTAQLRFGDGTNGFRPVSGTAFSAVYRIGNGAAGNVGAESLILFAGGPGITACRNPLPAAGGVEPESAQQIRRRAPQAFLTQERAVTMADYAHVAEMTAQVEDAAATPRWTGSWYTIFVTAEPHGGGNLTAALSKTLRQNINRYRLAGQDIELRPPDYVPLQITLEVCVLSGYFRQDVEQGLQAVLGSKLLPDGQKGLFFPDNFTFGQSVYLSRVYAAARTVAGVQSVRATVFQRQGVSTPIYLSMGMIPIGPFQIARLDNDRSYPNHGQLTLVMEGGK